MMPAILKRFPRPGTIRGKLLLWSAGSLLLAIMLVFALIMYQQHRLIRQEWSDSLTAQARLVATNSRAALAFGDRKEAAHLLSAVDTNPSILRARLLIDEDHKVFAEFARAPTSPMPVPGIPAEGHGVHFGAGMLTVWVPVPDGASEAAMVELTASIQAMRQSMLHTALESGLALLAALGLLLWLSSRLVNRMSAPIENLSELMERVGTDVSLPDRAMVRGDDEIAQMGMNFNTMVDSLQARDRELAGYRENLEHLVEQRTHALILATEEARQADRAKSAFLATMSHEIRTPLNGVLGMAQLLLMDDYSDEERQEFTRTILNSGQILLTLLNDILDLSKVEAGKIELVSVVFDPRQLVEETTALFAQLAETKGLTIGATWHGPPDQRYKADASRLRQMLSNLIGNAIKFTSRGFVRIDAYEVMHQEGEACLEFSVTDSGIGIPPDKQANLFHPFTQADSTITREYGGTGLGLSIIRSLAKLMDGDVGLDSEPGKGSRFWFRIRAEPLAKGKESRLAQRGAWTERVTQAASGLRGLILVVEDDPINRKVIEAMLGKRGILTESVENGQEAVDLIQQGLCPDLVLMDLQMPIMDGVTATERIRQWEKETRHPPLRIIALTAEAFEEDRQHCIAAGMDGFLTKPVTAPALHAVLDKSLPSPPKPLNESPQATASKRPVDARRLVSLVAEIIPLLAEYKFDAVIRLRELQALATGTELAAEVEEIGGMVVAFRFDMALKRLQRLVSATQGLEHLK